MAKLVVSLLLTLCCVVPIISVALTESDDVPSDFNRLYFPSDFHWGTSSASYQYEGAANKSGRGPSIWDTFAHDYPYRITDGSNGDIANEFYHRFREDAARMKHFNVNAFRISISWSRVIPSGKLREGVNEEGVRFYKKLINDLIRQGIVPYVTLFHFDTPQALEDRYGGFLSPNIVDDFKDYADFCFQTFGDEVKHWVTFNEPYTFSIYDYDYGQHAPGRCSNWVNRDCQAGDSATEPYLVAHNQLLSHAAAVDLYRTKYQATQNGRIGIVLNCEWMEPYSNSTRNEDASKRALDFQLGWFLDPVTYGDYPASMRPRAQERLPRFTETQSSLLRGSIDFLGLNYYSSNYVQDANKTDPFHVRAVTDNGVITGNMSSDGEPIGPCYPPYGMCIVPWGLRKLLIYIKDTYNNPEIIITENGFGSSDNGTVPLEESINDKTRLEYHRDHIWNAYRAINEFKVNLTGYLLWSLLDNYEWSSGYTIKFGIVHVNYTNQKRTNKHSALWFKHFLSPHPKPEFIRLYEDI